MRMEHLTELKCEAGHVIYTYQAWASTNIFGSCPVCKGEMKRTYETQVMFQR